jgi:hypothetical protein
MNESKKGTLATGIILVLLGAAFIVINLVPGMTGGKTWPFIFIVAGIGFLLPAMIWPNAREGLAGLYIPGMIFIVLGGIFLFNVLSGAWEVWAYAWILIPAAVGLGLYTGALIGKWHDDVRKTGIWMMVISVSVFALFAALFGNTLVKAIGAGFLILIGIIIVLRALLKKQPSA